MASETATQIRFHGQSRVALPAQWDRATCRTIINRLRDGLPPPVEAIDFLSVGAEPYLDTVRRGLARAASGGYECTILVGRYGIGKSHLLRRVQVLAEAQDFDVRSLEIGQGRVYFNDPEEIVRLVAGCQLRDRLPLGRGYYTDRKFIDQLNYVANACMQPPRERLGLVILFDEMENSLDWSNLPQLRNRIRAYRYLNALFTGTNRNETLPLSLANIYVMMAITPGVIERAKSEEPGYLQGAKWVDNPAIGWRNGGLPTQLEIAPLDGTQAGILLARVREIHSEALGWDAASYVPDDRLQSIVRDWLRDGSNREERMLVRTAVAILEQEEQAR